MKYNGLSTRFSPVPFLLCKTISPLVLLFIMLLCLPDEVCNLVTASSSIAGVDNVGKQASVGKTGVESMNFTFKKLDFNKYGVKRKIVTF